MKAATESSIRPLLAGILLLLALAVVAGCEKATLGDGMPDGQSADDFHGAAWTAKGKHGLEFMKNTVSCDPCHGEELKGGVSEVSCDVCHPGWEGDCTFCHGGMENNTGAPPFDVEGETERRFASVGAHSVHVEGTESHVAFGCNTCHGKDFISYSDEGHLEGGEIAAELTFSGLPETGGRYDRGTAMCSQLYCHGDGQTRGGTLSWVSDLPMGCESCHGYGNNPQGMSGWHGLHLRLNQFGCEACHVPVVDVQGRFRDRALHINGEKDVGFENGSYDENTRTCSTSCHETVAVWSEEYHPVGWSEDTQHGYAFYRESDSCRTCHGASLLGGDSGISCDSCHTGGTSKWRSDCDFCHGGIDNATGAPPEGIYGETARASAAVGAHTAHVQDTAMHAAYDCTLCHEKPASFDDPNHIDTVSGAEMQFGPLAGTGATYSPSTARCASVYCHGDGVNPSGQIVWTDDLQMACDSCHGDQNDPQGLSGRHGSHLAELGCDECHAAVVSPAGEVIDKSLHVNGRPDVQFASGGSFDPGTMTCTTAAGCHDGEIPWTGDYHTDTWSEMAQHGYAFYDDPEKCKSCHGETLTGGTSGSSCDSCHTNDTAAWRTECTFCHGGIDNATGAPPEGIYGETARASAAVGAHTAHVQDTAMHAAYDCTLCHEKPASFDDPNHIDTVSGAEMQFGPLAGTGATYSPSTARCASVYCHGDGVNPSGQIVWTDDLQMACDSCHGDQNDPQSLSGRHGSHLAELGCDECHAAVVSPAGEVIDKSLHVNGRPDVQFASGGSFDPGTMTCTTAAGCHDGEIPWTGDYHTDTWSEMAQHGYAFYDDPEKCKSCHGETLTGGTSGSSCDSCHTGGTSAWRSECTFCHGGMDNPTGAPPEGVHGETSRSLAEVGAHTAHVQDTAMHAAFDCTLCHEKPASFDDPNHIDTVNGAEMQFGPLAGTGAAYSPTTTRCASLYCHGDGRNPSGQVPWRVDLQMGCNSCHGYQGDPQGLSGRHATHVAEVGCESCHAGVVSAVGGVIDKRLHVNGRADVELAPGESYDPGTMTCTTACHGGEIPWEGAYHPQGWSDGGQHGFTFYTDPANCESCHGQALTGGTSGVSCDACHTGGTSAWRSDCTFCHGGLDNPTGAPPEGVHGETLRFLAEVGAHTAHVEETATHTAYDCTMCHNKPASFDDPNHIDTVNGAEMQFGSLAGTGAAYNSFTTRCVSLYCHGDGRNPSGQIPWAVDVQMACNSCHGYQGDPQGLSGRHATHVAEVGCESCHAGVVSAAGGVIDKRLHVNGRADVELAPGESYDPGTMTCTTACHGGEIPWEGAYHPQGWSGGGQHGSSFYTDPANCEACHGQALTGGTSGVSCDSCHTGGTSAWRSDCTFCHGGLDNPTGAPPEGVHGETLRTLAEVGAHTAHVEETATHTAYDCTMCHNKPAFFDDPNHIDTNNGAEMAFGPLAGTGAAYSPTTTQCASLYCHGNGRNPSGQVPWAVDLQMACNSCHGYTANPRALSGEHNKHIRESIACGVCHSQVMSGSATIVRRDLHINGAKNVNITNGGVYNTATRTCSSITCHGSERW